MSLLTAIWKVNFFQYNYILFSSHQWTHFKILHKIQALLLADFGTMLHISRWLLIFYFVLNTCHFCILVKFFLGMYLSHSLVIFFKFLLKLLITYPNFDKYSPPDNFPNCKNNEERIINSKKAERHFLNITYLLCFITTCNCLGKEMSLWS